MSKARHQTRRQRVEAKELAIITAARAEFQKHGFDKAKIAQIAKRAGVAEGTVYLYFENKNALLNAVATEFYEKLTRDAAAGIAGIPQTTPRLAFLAHHHLKRIAAEWPILSTAMMPYKASEDYRQSEGYQLNRTYVGVFDQVIRDGINRGDIRADIPLSVMRDVFYGGLEYGARTIRMRPAKADLDKTVDCIMAVLTAGMLVPTPGAVTSDNKPDTATDATLARLERVTARLESTAAAGSQI